MSRFCFASNSDVTSAPTASRWNLRGQPLWHSDASPMQVTAIIMITAYGDAETKRRALENGAEALLTKPIDFGMLRSMIDTRVERAA